VEGSGVLVPRVLPLALDLIEVVEGAYAPKGGADLTSERRSLDVARGCRIYAAVGRDAPCSDPAPCGQRRRRTIVLAAVVVDVIAVVTLLVAVLDAVAAEGAGVGPARSPRTAGAVGRGSIGREGVGVARLARLVDDAIAACR